MDELMLKLDNVSKQYKLGEIGGTTLRDELQRLNAKLHGREDPTKKIGAKNYNKGETFMALDGVSFEVKKGERVGIIGHNGAGKSTLLKLISRVTAPSGGRIGLNGRVASMLEVGTGFHPELTGRENIYMNGAILGMTKKEIDDKMENIIEFSECRQFIDTPVKRYSSGMYVKLAFSVAAHLDSEIMIMDEVLAVGDMAFQKKCLDKMSDVSKTEGRTILYVSHNMNTIRQLCERVIVLDHGKIVFDGDVEEGIGVYASVFVDVNYQCLDLSTLRMPHLTDPIFVKMTELRIESDCAIFNMGDTIRFILQINSRDIGRKLSLRIEIFTKDRNPVGITHIQDFDTISQTGKIEYRFIMDVHEMVPGDYFVCLVLYEKCEHGVYYDLDAIFPTFPFTIVDYEGRLKINWNYSTWGRIQFNNLICEEIQP